MATNGYVYNQKLIIGVTTFVLTLAIISYALRLYARRISEAPIWFDDITIGIGLLLSCIPCICNYVGLRFGFGEHASEVSAYNIETYLKVLYIQQMAWVWMMPTIKVGILLFYYRLFPNPTFRKAIYGVSAFVIACLLSTFFGFLFQCVPIQSFWQQQIPHQCFNQNPFYICVAVLSLVSDVVILLMPIPVIWALQTSKQRKVGLSIVFLLGGCVCIISFGRLFSLSQTNLNDSTYTNIAPGLWSTAEGSIGVLSANMPSLRPLFSCMARSSHISRSYSRNSTPSLALRYLHPRSERFERVNETSHGTQKTEFSAAKISARAVREGLDTEVGIPLHGIAVITRIDQEVGSEGTRNMELR